MNTLKWLAVVFLCVFSAAVASESSARQENLEAGNEARIFNVRLFQDEDSNWLLRGRVTRTDKDVKVPTGQVVVIVYNDEGKPVFAQSSHYKPGFVHRKTKRASYFTLNIPAQINMNDRTIRLFYSKQ
ncbi:MAG: hypothetical protein V7731_16965 [Amphritea sp.]